MKGYKYLTITCDYGTNSVCENTYPIKEDYEPTIFSLMLHGNITCETFDEHKYYLKEIRFEKEEEYIHVVFFSDWWNEHCDKIILKNKEMKKKNKK
jgi:hypothetical protein